MNDNSRKNAFRTRAIIIGILILAAYGVVVSAVTGSLPVIMTIEILSGFAVIGAAVLYLPVLKPYNQNLTYSYILIKTIEGILVIAAAFMYISLISDPDASREQFDLTREILYQVIEFLFGIRFLLLGICLYQSRIVPRFIALWDIVASTIMLGAAIINFALGNDLIPEYISHPLLITNEIFLAFWLIFKGFDSRYIINHNN